MKSFFPILNFSVALLFIGCAPTSSLQPDEVLLTHSKNNIGTASTSIQEIARAPETNAFRVQEVQHLEELIESAQISRAESREAIFVGETESPLLNGPFSDALPSGLAVQPRENIQIIWPLDIVNGYVKVKNSRDSISWLKYKSDLNQVQVALLENFIIPQVSIIDSRLITITQQTDPSENTEVEAVAISIEESKEIPQAIEDPDVEDIKAEGVTQVTPEENTPTTDIELDTPSEIINTELPPEEENHVIDSAADITPDDVDNAISLAPLTSPRSEHLVVTSPQAPLITAAGLSARELLDSLGITEVPISNETRYLQEGERKISEVFHRGHKHFSACTFNPAQGSTKSRCYKELVLSEEFADFLEQKGQMCAENAAQEVFEKSPLKVLLKTNGGSLNRSSTSSLHSRGRALDVFKVSLYFEQGTDPREIPFHSSQVDGQSVTERQNYNFYWSFHNCWTKEITDYHQTKACGGRGRGALTYRYNADHTDHMHISLPVCRDLRQRFNLNST